MLFISWNYFFNLSIAPVFLFASYVFYHITLSWFPSKSDVYRLSYLYPAETSFDLQLLHQLPSLADTHGAVHWGVSFHPNQKHMQQKFYEYNASLSLN